MEFFLKNGSLTEQRCDCLVVGVYDGCTLSSFAQELDAHCKGLLSSLVKRNGVQGKIGEAHLFAYIPGVEAHQILLLGLGKQAAVSAPAYRKALIAASGVLKKCGAKNVLFALSDTRVEHRDAAWLAKQAVELLQGSMYQFTQTKSKLPEPASLTRSDWFLGKDVDPVPVQKGLDQGQAIANGVNLARELANLPGNICTPEYLAEQARALSKSHDSIECKILNEADMTELGMGALLSVSRGSRQEAKLVILEYTGGSDGDKPVVLIGKGLTFDAGGISLKSAAGMDEMKYDMCGGASVLGTVSAAAELGLPMNVVGVIPASENMPDGDANKPGDVVTSMSGKTIEVLNTDAEGRLLLCDALTYVERYKPAVVIDIATLTGACVVALGRHASGLMGNDDALCDSLLQSGEQASDRVWRLPVWREYQEQLKSNFADMANIGGRDAGTITAACFLARFAENYHWAHLDIAGTAWNTGAQKGATGRPVPLLVQYLLDRV